jgi:small subunit ribosomal protein S20
MPNTTTAKKALRQNHKRRLQNRSQRSALRTAVRKIREIAATGDTAAAEAALKQVSKKLDQAADKHLIHKNAAARTKSRLVRLIRSKQSGAAAAPAPNPAS